MSDNSNPQGTGTDTMPDDDGLDAFLADSETSNQEQEPQTEVEGEQPEGESQEGEESSPAEKYYILADGTKVTEAEFNTQFMPMPVYTQQRQKDSAIAKEAEAKLARLTEQASLIDAQQKQLELSHAATEDFLASQIPPEPDLTLASTDPAEYWRQKAYYDHALGNLQRFANTRHQQRSEYEQQVENNRQKLMALENQKLEQAFPQLSDPVKREAFHRANYAEAAKYGFSVDEYNGTNAAAKRLLARLSFLEAKEKARTTPPVQKQAQPGVVVQGKQSVVTKQSKDVQAFRQSGSATNAKKALESGAFDHLI